jgi:hypothetical protein
MFLRLLILKNAALPVELGLRPREWIGLTGF